MAEAHVSYSKDFEASCVEADAMVELAQDLPGLIGARLTGGGFGGCTINLVERTSAAILPKSLAARYSTGNGDCAADSHLPCLGRGTPGRVNRLCWSRLSIASKGFGGPITELEKLVTVADWEVFAPGQTIDFLAKI